LEENKIGFSSSFPSISGSFFTKGFASTNNEEIPPTDDFKLTIFSLKIVFRFLG